MQSIESPANDRDKMVSELKPTTMLEATVVEWEGQPGKEGGDKPAPPPPTRAKIHRSTTRDRIAKMEELLSDVASLRGETIIHCLVILCDLVTGWDVTVRILTQQWEVLETIHSRTLPLRSS